MVGISIENVSKSYDRQARAVDNLSLNIAPGEFVCLLGPSGCGKTTTLRMIAGLERVDSGSIRLGDTYCDRPENRVFISPENRDLGLVFQSYALWPHMTVEENVAFGLRMRGEEKATREKTVRESLALLRMEQYNKRYPAELSGGQQQRVALARMLAVEPSVLLLDEPLSNLDAALRLEMRSELKRLHSQLGNTIVFVTHDQLEAMSLATYIAVMNEGKLEQFSTPMDVYKKPATAFVARFVGSPPMNMMHISQESKVASWIDDMRTHVASARGIPVPQSIATIGFRPEDAMIEMPSSRNVSRCWHGSAQIQAVLPTGAETIVSLSIQETQVYVVVDAESTIEEGETRDVFVPYERIHLFDNDGLRIEPA